MPLIIESHPENYSGYPFITLIQFRQEHILTIVDNVTPKQVHAFVLDRCQSVGVDEGLILPIAEEWYNERRDQYPISIEFSRRGLSSQVASLRQTFNVEFISRVIGPYPHYEMLEVESIKRRRRKVISPNVEIKKK
jgi:hypothetical protein